MERSIRTLGLVVAVFIAFGGAACGKKSKSSRDTRREQLRIHAESKRQELVGINGEYFGRLWQGEVEGQSVTLNLQIKDVPYTEEGQVDPVLIPTLAGFLHFNYGGAAAGEAGSISFAVQKADYDVKGGLLNLTAENSQYKAITLTLRRDAAGDFAGDWAAPDLSATGETSLRRSIASGGTAQLTDFPSHTLGGDYAGLMTWRAAKRHQEGSLTITTAISPPDGLTLAASLRLYFGGADSNEFLTYTFETIDFKPITGQLAIRNEAGLVVFSGLLANGEIVGEWATASIGNMGGFRFAKGDYPRAPRGSTPVEALRGTLFGQVTTTHPDAQLPERMLLSLVTSEEPEKPQGIDISGNFRLYIGDFDSDEYLELAFSHIEFNFFTRKFVGKTTGTYNMTLKGDVTAEGLVGKLYTDALGEVADVDLQRGSPTGGSDDGVTP